MSNTAESRHTNRLIHSTSPYLLQHAHNPVDWYPWGEEALLRAQRENMPIFLSIGYSACHWCHVMERESFENESIASIMNQSFICIKVDREERPDLDEIYMSAVQAMTGSGGWPMSVFLTPDLKPFYGGTYYPPDDRYGRPGFPGLLRSIALAFREHPVEMAQSADRLTQHIQSLMHVQRGETDLDDSLIEHGYEDIRSRFDSQHGGFGGAPKFPHSMDLSLLLRYAHKTGTTQALQMVELSLYQMARGGIYDQIGGGFHRYSTDARWLIPHFEKMLYDNALLAKTYTEAYQKTHNPYYKNIITETLDYVLREMTSPAGGFYSTQDADSEGAEGAFFSWTPLQITEAVGPEYAPMVCRYYGVEEEGNFEEGTSVLSIAHSLDEVAQSFAIPKDQLEDILQTAKRQLFIAREKRIKPGRDEKILTDWNGLMISAMAFAGNVLGESRYIQAAEKACDFILKELFPHEVLFHTCKDGRAHTSGFLSDYAFLIHGLLDTYEATRNPRWLEKALRLVRIMNKQFWDELDGAFFFTSNHHEKLIARSKNPMDNAVPSGNSMAILCLLRLGVITGDTTYRERARTSLKVFSDGLKRIPSGFTQMLSALDFLLAPPHEIVLAGENEDSLLPMQEALFQHFLPNQVVLYHYPQVEETLRSISPITEGKKPLDGGPTAYICQNNTCQPPSTSVEELLDRLRN